MNFGYLLVENEELIHQDTKIYLKSLFLSTYILLSQSTYLKYKIICQSY